MNIEEAKNIVAVKHGYEGWNDLYWRTIKDELFEFENEAALLHTKHHVEQALKAASETVGVNSYVILNAYSIENIQ